VEKKENKFSTSNEYLVLGDLYKISDVWCSGI